MNFASITVHRYISWFLTFVQPSRHLCHNIICSDSQQFKSSKLQISLLRLFIHLLRGFSELVLQRFVHKRTSQPKFYSKQATKINKSPLSLGKRSLCLEMGSFCLLQSPFFQLGRQHTPAGKSLAAFSSICLPAENPSSEGNYQREA